MRESIGDEVYRVHSSLGRRPRPMFFCVTDLFLSQVSQEETIITMFLFYFFLSVPSGKSKIENVIFRRHPGLFYGKMPFGPGAAIAKEKKDVRWKNKRGGKVIAQLFCVFEESGAPLRHRVIA